MQSNSFPEFMEPYRALYNFISGALTLMVTQKSYYASRKKLNSSEMKEGGKQQRYSNMPVTF